MTETLVNWSCSEKLLLHVLQSEKKWWNIYLGLRSTIRQSPLLFQIWLWWHFIKVVAIKINRKIESNWFMTHCYLRTNISITCHLLYLDIPIIRNMKKKSWNQISFFFFFFFHVPKISWNHRLHFHFSVAKKNREIKKYTFLHSVEKSSHCLYGEKKSTFFSSNQRFYERSY